MAAPVEVQLRNAQSSILFMQQEHAQTLQGLHGELQKLQKKCAELTFELAMKEGSPDEEQYIKQVKVLEAEIKESKVEKNQLEKEVDKKERRIVILEQQLKVQEKKFLDEIKKQKQAGNQCKAELEKKSEMIAHLTAQIHQLNIHKHKRSVSLDEDHARTASPQPPSQPRPNFRRPHKHVRSPEEGAVRKAHRPMRTIPVDGLTREGMTLSELRQQFSRGRSKENQNKPTVNVSAFLVQTEPKNSVGVKVAPPVLPPIHSRRGTRSPHHPSSSITHHQSPSILAKDDPSRLSTRNEHDSAQSPERHTLAVKKLFSNEKKLVEESKSD